MNSTRSSNSKREFSPLDFMLWVVTGMIVFLAVTSISKGGRSTKGYRISCISNLKQVALAARMWANDHGDKFPWQVSTNAGGTLELVASGGAYRQFLALSNELTKPTVLTCPSDKRRTRAQHYLTDFKSDRNVSYFVGLDASEAMPQTMLSGDRNITGGTLDRAGIMTFDSPETAGWTKGVHDEQGNIVFADGSAQQVSSSLWLQRHMKSHLALTNSARFLIPLVP